MQFLDGELVLSPSDLTGFTACAHLTQLELSAARGELERPRRDDALLDVLSRLGDEHETTHLERFRTEGRTIAEITTDHWTRADLYAAEAATLEAMRAGVEVIYQATFFDGRWRGHADFLLRVDQPRPALGGWSYEVADTKLARRVKAAAILQMAAYAEQLERLQGVAPEYLHVIAGDGERHRVRTADYAAYHRTVKARFEAVVLGSPVDTYPEKVDHCSICRWSEQCERRRRDDDHLSLVAGMRSDQARRLTDAGVPTRHALAAFTPGLHVDGIGDRPLERLRHQAEVQVRGENAGEILYDVLAPERPEIDGEPWPKRGLAVLPPPSPGDLFFDMEGDPYALDGGLEYLFGVVDLDDGESRFTAFWAHDRDEEKAAFEAFIDLVMARRAVDPEMHVYHYAPYEPSAVKRLMGTHGTREREVDVLLRGGVFVDLYAAVKGGVRLSTDSYSLKEVEKLYLTRPPGAVMDAGASIVAYEDWLQHADPQILADIARYNEDDCTSLVGLRDWLEVRRLEAEAAFEPIPRPVPSDGAASPELDDRERRVVELAARLDEQRDDAAALLGDLLSWHRREAKPEWWRYYQRVQAYDDEDFVADRECIGDLQLVGEVGQVKQSTIYRYEFPPQDHKFRVGDTPENPATRGSAGTIAFIDDALGVLEMTRATRLTDRPHARNLMPGSPFSTPKQEDAIFEVGTWVAEHGIDAPGPHRAVRDLLQRRPPPFVGALDDAYLAVQGPPGSGKTTEGARLIVDLVCDGQKRVGVTANSHAVIGNLLDAVAREAERRGTAVRLFQKCDPDDLCAAALDRRLVSNADAAAVLAAGEADVVGGTSWLWADEQLRGAVDVLVVDEAGQLSLANLVAVSVCASGIVLLGDPQQLAQPSKGSHPDGAGASALGHLLGEARTMPDELGRFLATTHRLHPDVCRFVSEVSYEGKLSSEPGLERISVGGDAGVRYVPVGHFGNRVASTEEAERVGELVEGLLGRTFVDKHGHERTMTTDDVLVVAPYNAHVARLRSCLSAAVAIGTVDKFQGREAPVVIYSMATSTPEDVPRGMDFLYDVHRLNVAVSRAQALAFVVCSPALLEVLCRTPDQMRMANALCRYTELARIDHERGSSPSS